MGARGVGHAKALLLTLTLLAGLRKGAIQNRSAGQSLMGGDRYGRRTKYGETIEKEQVPHLRNGVPPDLAD